MDIKHLGSQKKKKTQTSQRREKKSILILTLVPNPPRMQPMIWKRQLSKASTEFTVFFAFYKISPCNTKKKTLLTSIMPRTSSIWRLLLCWLQVWRQRSHDQHHVAAAAVYDGVAANCCSFRFITYFIFTSAHN